MEGVSLRDAGAADIPALLRLIRGLAEYERLADRAVATPAALRAHMFGAVPRAHALLAEAHGEAVGLALYFFSFSTFTGRPSLYVEDVFVQPGHRGRGIGRAFFRVLAARAVAADCARMDWSVLDWNTDAQAFYRGLGARPLDEWTGFRLDGEALASLARATGEAAAPDRDAAGPIDHPT